MSTAQDRWVARMLVLFIRNYPHVVRRVMRAMGVHHDL